MLNSATAMTPATTVQATKNCMAGLVMTCSSPEAALIVFAVVLGFIGLKLVGEFGGVEVPTVSSLLFVLGVLGTGVGASILEATADGEAS